MTDIYTEYEKFIPERSQLYSIAPINLKNNLVQSFPHYLENLINAHCLPWNSFIRKVVFPMIHTNIPVSRLLNLNFAEFGVIQELCSVIATLTKQPDIHYSTLLHLRNIVSSKNLFRSFRSWCPHCLKEQNNSPYEPLLWTIESVNLCPIHQTFLSTICPNCRTQIPTFHPRKPYGFCIKCNENFLKLTKRKRINPNELRYAQIASELITFSATETTTINLNNILQYFYSVIGAEFEGKILLFSEALGIHPRQIIRICFDYQLPSIEILIKSIIHSGETAHQFFENLKNYNEPVAGLWFKNKL